MQARSVRMDDGTWAVAVECGCCGRTVFLSKPDIVTEAEGETHPDVLTPMMLHHQEC